MENPQERKKTPRRGKNVGPLAQNTLAVRVSYRDTDQMGFVYYANFLVYFEMARTDLLRGLGRSYRECEEAGIFLPVLEATCQYLAPGHYDDLIDVSARVTRWTRAAINFDDECRRREDGALLATGSTRHAFTNREGRVARVGDKILA